MSKKGRMIIAVAVSSIVLVSAAIIFPRKAVTANAGAEFSGLRAAETDNRITVSWSPLDLSDTQYTALEITGEDYSQVVKIDTMQTEYVFENGRHGKKYTFSLISDKINETDGIKNSVSAMFLDFEQLPDIPFLQIDTVTGEFPTCTYVDAPEGCWGASVTDNEYVSAKIHYAYPGNDKIECNGQIRIRGNTSARYYAKKPYRIKLERSIDLLNRGDAEYKDTDWVLINYYGNFATETGFAVSEICDMEYTPGCVPVNLMINGSWQGLYILTEQVEKGINRVDVSNSGFIIENDAYWWKEGNNYFKTDNDWYPLSYTFRYPDTTVPESLKTVIRNYVNDYENALLAENPDYSKYIDLDSYAGWLMVHDIMGTWDAGGSNMFMYKYDLNLNNIFSSKMKMGPIWDLNSAYSKENEWSSIHVDWALKYEIMFRMPDFRQTYIDKWNELSPVLVEKTEEYMTEYMEQYGEGLQQSFYLDTAKWGTEHNTVRQQQQFVLDWMKNRVEWMNEATSLL
ncbi:MAG: hypothetical protein E7484_05345 [Ruminococcaceae bacterium]|nr:hypothetical protein [Oscillospiraceae bacterium]